MELKAHFNNIHQAIMTHLAQAETDIMAAVAWFTDRDIYELLCKKATAGINVSIILIDDQINQGPGGLHFDRLREVGGEVTLLPSGSRDEPMMHHKFCVIDGSTVITGSYNWSHKARSNDENITVVTEAAKFAADYLDTFNALLVRAGRSAPPVVDAEAARRRLEMIRNLVMLGEQDDIATHVYKLRPVAEALYLSPIIDALDQGEYRRALEAIESYLRKATALVTAADADSADIPQLRFLLETLELRLESLSTEKADIERKLIVFNRLQDEVLGDLIQRVLKARAELARLNVAARKTEEERAAAEAEAEEAEEAHEDYTRYHDEQKQVAPPRQLNENDEQELKNLYRKACHLCHPDKVPEDKKAAAHLAFVELQDAYQANDLPRVREIHATLIAGGLLGTRSGTLSKTTALRAAIAELGHAITKQVAELKALYASDGYQLMSTAGTTEADWRRYFDQQYALLEQELGRLVSVLIDEYRETANERTHPRS
jgi:hypothetical protein